MGDLFFWLALLIVSLVVLIKSSDYFTNSAEKMGLHFGISPFVVGITIVAIGTSLPELVSSLIAVFNDSSEIVVGNVIGSNIANIFLILGVAGIIARKKLEITKNLLHVDLPILVASAFLLAITIWDGKFTFIEAILCLAGMTIYSFYLISSRTREADIKIKEELKGEVIKNGLPPKVWIILLVSSFFIYLGAKFTIESVLELSEILQIGKEIIAISAVALGTSLPELFVTISAARKGKPEMAVGNVLGSNIFNTFVVMGIPGLFGNLIIPSNIILFSLPMMLIATFLFFMITQDKEITRWEGGILIIFYVFFIGKLFGLF